MSGASFHAFYTVVLFVIFIGIVVWAYSRRRKKDFDEAARLALDDDHPVDRDGEGEHKS
jgi:cytochrome c oxidase cbb3-type subunit 4